MHGGLFDIVSAVVPLVVTEVQPGHYRVEVLVRVGDFEETFLLDTGAPKTTLAASERTAHHVAIRASESRGAADVGIASEDIVLDSLELGGRRFAPFPASRGGGAANHLLGLDALGERFRIDLRRRLLTLDPDLSDAAMVATLRCLDRGHLTIPARLGDVDVHVLFDTGADATLVDSAFVAAHSDRFRKRRIEDGRDVTGATIPSEVYELSSLHIGPLELHDVEIATFPFSEAMRRDLGPSTPAILGTNVIEHAAWTFDVPTKRWSVVSR